MIPLILFAAVDDHQVFFKRCNEEEGSQKAKFYALYEGKSRCIGGEHTMPVRGVQCPGRGHLYRHGQAGVHI